MMIDYRYGSLESTVYVVATVVTIKTNNNKIMNNHENEGGYFYILLPHTKNVS